MAIKRFNDYEKTQAYGEIQQLPKGAYILKVLGVDLNVNSVGEYITLHCDVLEGEYKDFFAKDYKAQQSEDKKWHCNFFINVPNDDGSEKDGWAKRRFKTIMEAFEESNEGYHFDWDEAKLKGKTIGGLFNIREYEKRDGSVGSATNLAQLCKVSSVRNETYKIPDDKRLQRKLAPATDEDGFMKIPDGVDEELPFN